MISISSEASQNGTTVPRHRRRSKKVELLRTIPHGLGRALHDRWRPSGRVLPDSIDQLRKLEFGVGSQINIPIAVLIWLMIVPMMMKVDFASIRNVGKKPRGLFVTLFVNWLVKPFSMAFIAWLFFRLIFGNWISAADADQYIAGCIILAAAPCTAM